MLEHEARDFGRPVPEIMGNSVREHSVLTMLGVWKENAGNFRKSPPYIIGSNAREHSVRTYDTRSFEGKCYV